MIAFVVLAACGDEPQPVDDESCGDGACSAGENQLTCARDCPTILRFDGSIDACAADLDQADLDDLLAPISAAADGLGDLPMGGRLAMELSDGLVDVVPYLMADLGEVLIPIWFGYGGEGRYVSASSVTWSWGDQSWTASGSETVEYLLGGDYEQLGPEDTVVPADLFDRDSYLVNPSFGLDPRSGDVLLSYDEAGPLVELLGFGADPPNPIAVPPSEVDEVGAAIPRLKMRSTLVLDYPDHLAHAHLEVVSDPRRISPLLADQGFDLDRIDGAATSDGGRRWTATDLALAYDDHQDGHLTGTVGFRVDGEPSLEGTFAYDGSPWPQITLACALR
jgi:hypothetical protein